MANQILHNANIDLKGYSPSVYNDVLAASKGQPGTGGAYTSSVILRLIATLGQDHKVLVTAIQSNGQGHCLRDGVLQPKSACPNDAHYNGDAIDFGNLDGVSLTGRDDKSLSIINLAVKLLPAGTGFGQQGCNGGTATIPDTDQQFPDSCNHLHIQIPLNTP